MRPDSLPRRWRYINLLLTYLLTYLRNYSLHVTLAIDTCFYLTLYKRMIKKDYYVAAYNLCLMFPSEQPTRISLPYSSTVIDFQQSLILLMCR